MSRSNYSDEGEYMALWRGAVQSAINGKRGQALLKEMLIALDDMPSKRLIAGNLQNADGEVCAIGTVFAKRGVNMKAIDPEDYEAVARAAGVSEALAREIEYENDEGGPWRGESPEERFARIRSWVVEQIRPELT